MNSETIQLTPALTGQILVSAILATVVAILLVAGVARLFRGLAERLVGAGFPPEGPLDRSLQDSYEDRWVFDHSISRDDDDEIHEDFEHMRVVREHGAVTALEHRSIPYRGIAT